MFKNNLEHYIVEVNENLVYRISYIQNSGVLCQIISSDRAISNYQIVCKNSTENFSVLLDDQNYVHVICLDKFNNIAIYINKNNNWVEQAIFPYITRENFSTKIKAVLYNNLIYLLYLIPQKDLINHALFYQILNNYLPTNHINVIDIISSVENNPFSYLKTNNDTLYILYQLFIENYILGFRCLSLSNKKLNDFYFISSSERPFLDWSIITSSNKVHFIYIKQSENTCKLIYRCRNALWNNSILLFETKKIDSCILYIIKENLYAAYVSDNILYYCLSKDNGTTFSSPLVYDKLEYYTPTKVQFISNNLFIENEKLINDIYISLQNKKCIFLLPELSLSPPKENISDTIQRLKKK